MKKYVTPELLLIVISSLDVISTSLGTETSKLDENDGIWDMDIN